MPSYKITAPDGKSYKVTVPEGGTEQDALNHFKSQFQAQPETKVESDPYKATAQKQSNVTDKNFALAKRLLNSPIGGIIRGIRDIPDAGAEMLVTGLNAIAPKGTAFDKFTENELNKVRGINKAAETDYRQNWRDGEDIGFDGGRLTGNIVASALIPGASTYTGSAAIGGGLGMLNADENSKLDNAILGAAGGVAGNAIGRGISSLFKPVPRLPSETRDAAVKTAESLGMKLTPGDKTQSLALQQIEAVLSRTPGGAGIFDRAKDLNQKALNKIAAQTIGENADELSAPVIAKAADRINKTFNELSAKSNVTLTDSFNGLIQKLKNTNDALGPFRNPQVDNLIEKSAALAQMKQIPGNVYQTIRSELTSSADDAFRSGNSGAGRALKDIRNALDDAAKNGLSKADQELWDTVRKQYAHLNTLVKGNVVSKGNVNPALVKNEMIKFNNKLYKSGKNESPLAAIGNVAENFKQMVPNSGTPEQTLMRQMMFGNPLTGLPITGAANLYSRLYMSQPVQNYLTKGIVDLSPELQRALALSGALSGASLGSTANQ